MRIHSSADSSDNSAFASLLQMLNDTTSLPGLPPVGSFLGEFALEPSDVFNDKAALKDFGPGSIVLDPRKIEGIHSNFTMNDLISCSVTNKGYSVVSVHRVNIKNCGDEEFYFVEITKAIKTTDELAAKLLDADTPINSRVEAIQSAPEFEIHLILTKRLKVAMRILGNWIIQNERRFKQESAPKEAESNDGLEIILKKTFGAGSFSELKSEDDIPGDISAPVRDLLKVILSAKTSN